MLGQDRDGQSAEGPALLCDSWAWAKQVFRILELAQFLACSAFEEVSELQL